MTNVVEIAGGDGVPPEPNWRTIFGRAAVRNAAARYWKSITNEIRAAEKLAIANSLSIIRPRCHGAGLVETGTDQIGLPDIEVSPEGYPR